MVNNISLRPNPATVSYFQHFQKAQFNLNLYIEEQRLQKRKRRSSNGVKVA